MTGRPSPVVLASASAARQHLLRSAGVDFVVRTAPVDERALRRSFEHARRARGEPATPRDVACMLATEKALAVSKLEPSALVIGGDQVLELAGEIFEKPRDMAEAGAHLSRLAGRAHMLHSAASMARQGVHVWSDCRSARLVMRSLTADEIARYLAGVGSRILGSVGAYEIENEGRNLFAQVDGDEPTIMGLPLELVIASLGKHGGMEQ